MKLYQIILLVLFAQPTFAQIDVQKAVDAGGLVQFPAGTYEISQTILITRSNTIIQGSGPDTVFHFKPTLPQLHCQNDRAFTTPCNIRDDTQGIASEGITSAPTSGSRKPISGAIAVGASTFQAENTADAAALAPGDWIIVEEKDNQVKDPVIFDWAMVQAVEGATVHVQTPFRTAFPHLRAWDPLWGGLSFSKIPTVIENVQFRDFTLIVDTPENAPGISVFCAKDTVIENVTVDDSNGQPFYSYLSKGLSVLNSNSKAGQTISEFAATVDLTLHGNTFSASSAGLGIDLGTGFFDFSGNQIVAAQGFGMYLTNGAHDGLVKDNSVSFVASSGLGAVGILIRGTQGLKVQRNNLAGGAGFSTGISIGTDFNLEVPLLALRNKIAPNVFGSWAINYDPAIGVFDFNRDGKTDLAVFRDGMWSVQTDKNGSVIGTSWGLQGDIPVPGDYDGDGVTDYAVYRPSEARWYIINSSTGEYTVRDWGIENALPVPGDYDGDGASDFAMYRDGNWYRINSSDQSYHLISWGIPGDIPVPADYDGDGITDVAIYRPSTGQWFIINSSNGSYTVRNWGIPGDVPVPGDYDGDGASDLAVWRPSNGTWFVVRSSDGSYDVHTWGRSGDTPVPADYDGDGKWDFAVWNAGAWNILSSTGLTMTGVLGNTGDMPVPFPLADRQILSSAP